MRHELELVGWLLDLRDATGDAFQEVVGAAAATGRASRVVYVCADERTLADFLARADGAVSAALERPGRPREEWDYPGREGILFCARGDAADARRQFWRLDSLPPAARGGQPPTPRRGEFRYRFGADEEVA